MKTPNLPGVYCIRNKENGLAYVGSSVKAIRQRWWQHRNDWSKGKGNRHIRADWIAFGEDSFEFKVLENVLDLTMVIEREQYWIGRLDSCFGGKGYNICPKAGNTFGIRHKHTERARASIASGNKGKNVGRVRSQETRENISQAKKGVPQSKDWYKKNQGKTWTTEQREKMIAARKDGRLKPPPNLKGRKRPESFKENLRAKRLGDANPNKGFPFRLCDPDGNIIEGTNLHRFAKQHGLDSSALSKIIKGKAKSHRGYTSP